MMGFAAGIMLAVCFWGLLEPAIQLGGLVPALVGLLVGGFSFWSVDKVLPHLHSGFPLEEAEGVKSSWHRSVLLVLAITLHNIPEGLAIGVAFGRECHAHRASATAHFPPRSSRSPRQSPQQRCLPREASCPMRLGSQPAQCSS
jgi:ZIP family zinc transporter